MMQFFPNEIASWLKNVHVVQKCYVQASYFCVLKSDKIMSAFFVIFGKKNGELQRQKMIPGLTSRRVTSIFYS